MGESNPQDLQSTDAPRSATAEAIFAKRAAAKRARRRAAVVSLLVATVVCVAVWFVPVLYLFALALTLLCIALVGLLAILQALWRLFPEGSVLGVAFFVAWLFLGVGLVLPFLEGIEERRRMDAAMEAMTTLDQMRNEHGQYPTAEVAMSVLPTGVKYVRSQGSAEAGTLPGQHVTLYVTSRGSFFVPSGHRLSSRDREWKYYD